MLEESSEGASLLDGFSLADASEEEGIAELGTWLEEAKSLLTYSDKTLSEISNYLCFSSQAYFQTVFKKKYGLTPKQYRNQTHKIY